MSAFGLALSPWLIFILMTCRLYLRNRSEFQGSWDNVSEIFLALFVGTYAIGWILFFLRRIPVARKILTLYYFAGPAFFLFNIAKPLLYFPELNLINWLLLLTIISWIAVKYDALICKDVAWRYAAAILLLFIVTDSDKLTEVIRVRSERQSLAIESTFPSDPIKYSTKKTLPNIYHLIFDRYRTDWFRNTLTQDRIDKLAGFSLFENNISIFDLTRLSIPATLHGRGWLGEPTVEGYLRAAFSEKGQFLKTLRDIGYDTYDLLSIFPKEFNEVMNHVITPRSDVAPKDRTFAYIWLYSFLPRSLTSFFVPRIRSINEDRFHLLPAVRNVVELDHFRKYLKAEANFPANNRYTYLHVLIPHSPHVLDRNCVHDSKLSEFSREEQLECATKLIMEFVETLKALDRFDSSIIVVHSDHGWGKNPLSKVKNARWDITEMKKNSAMLLYKRSYAKQVPLNRIYHATSLMDIAPTILEELKVSSPPRFEGRSLFTRQSATFEDPLKIFQFDSGDSTEKHINEFLVSGTRVSFIKTHTLKVH